MFYLLNDVCLFPVFLKLDAAIPTTANLTIWYTGSMYFSSRVKGFSITLFLALKSDY